MPGVSIEGVTDVFANIVRHAQTKVGLKGLKYVRLEQIESVFVRSSFREHDNEYRFGRPFVAHMLPVDSTSAPA